MQQKQAGAEGGKRSYDDTIFIGNLPWHITWQQLKDLFQEFSPEYVDVKLGPLWQGVPLTWVYINGHSANPFSNWITWASNTSTAADNGGTLPYVHSLSVGEPEDEFASDNGGVSAVLYTPLTSISEKRP